MVGRQETAHFSSLRFLMLSWTRNPSDAVCSQHTSSIWIRLSFSRNNSEKSIQVTVCSSVSSRLCSIRFCVVWGILYCVSENPIAGELWPTLQYADFTPQYTICLKSTCIVIKRRLPAHKVTMERRNSTDYSSQYSIHSGDKNSWIKWTRCRVVIADSSKGIVILIFSLKKY